MRIGLVGLLFSGLIGACHGQAIEYRTVALRGNVAPGTSAGTTFFGFEDSMVDSEGNVAFVAVLFGNDVNVNNERGLWAEHQGVLTLIAREGDQAPGMPAGVLFDRIFDPVMNSNGNTAFRAWLEGPGIDGTNRDSIWSESTGMGLGLVVQGGTPSGISGVDIGGFASPLLGDNDLVTVKTFLSGASVNSLNDEAILVQPATGQVAIVAREGDQADGAPAGVVYGIVAPESINASGVVSYAGTVTGAGVTATNNRGLWLAQTGGSIELIARGGEPAPGAGGDSYLAVGTSSLNSLGDLVYLASLQGPGVTFSNGSGVWKKRDGEPSQLLVRADTQSPGAPTGQHFGTFFVPLVNGTRSVGFAGELIGATVLPLEKRAIWSEGASTALELRLRGGNTSPDLAPGVSFSTLNSPALNADGLLVLPALLTGSGINTSNRDVLVGMEPGGDARILVRTGTMFDVDDDPNTTDLRLVVNPIRFVELSGGEDGRPTGLSRNGQAVFTLNFQQTFSGVFVASFAQPSCLADTNGDGFVTPADFSAWVAAFNTQAPACDQNGDGLCTPADFSAWVANYNLCKP
ncbi:MAG: hypothetical protein KDA31_05450 [Phycisphaerales bacterium]|nr:hypothetical protein [Phycisphaerales bacterium]MCB9837620.1 hypothetical protein [Phycisphaera sp.]